MLDFESEELVSMSEAASFVPCRRKGCKTSASTLWRWARLGVFGVKLETVRLPGGDMTSKEALTRFFKRVSKTRRKAATKAVKNG